MPEIPGYDPNSEGLVTLAPTEQLDEIEAARLRSVNEGLALPIPDYPEVAGTEALVNPVKPEKIAKLGGIAIGDSMPSDTPVDTSNIAQGYLDTIEAGLIQPQVTVEAIRKSDEIAGFAEKEAATDTLTGLLNRRGIENHVKEIGEENVSGIIMLDMNGLKKINDFGGHENGDDAIQKGASVLEDSVWLQDPNDVSKYKRADVKIARLGGDEFVIVLGPNSNPEEAKQILENIKENSSYTAPYKLTKTEEAPADLPDEVQLSFSAGHVSEFSSFSEGLHEADQLMYAQKKGLKAEEVPPRDERR